MLRPASEALPVELAALLAESPGARAARVRLTPGQQRTLGEDVLARKTPGSRRRWAERPHPPRGA